MDDIEILKKMHLLHLDLADELKRVCEKNNIKFFMIAGSLLGAVRHNGFIPWDDDMDFGMLREDYNKFLAICNDELENEKYFLQTEYNTDNYPFNFSKLRLKGTSVIEEYSKNAERQHGIYIDIFPIDNVCENPIGKAIQYRLFWIARNLLLRKCGYGKRSILNRFIYVIAKPFSINFLKQAKRNIITKYSFRKTKYVVTSDGNYGLKKETLLREWVEQICDYNFEDRIYPGIKNFDNYLRYLYGNYMLIPEESARNHHERIYVDFGEYGG